MGRKSWSPSGRGGLWEAELEAEWAGRGPRDAELGLMLAGRGLSWDAELDLMLVEGSWGYLLRNT